MTLTTFGEPACRRVLAKLDSYIDNELQAESNLELAEHLEGCPSCNRAMEESRHLRTRLQAAVREVKLPNGLEDRLRDRLRQTRRQPTNGLRLMALAATLAVCVGSWTMYRLDASRRALTASPDSFIASLAGGVNSILRVGLVDHLHCAVIRQRAKPPVPGTDKLAAPWKELVPLVRQYVPANMPLQVAHECTYRGRKFIHVTFRDRDHLLSLIVARKQDGESLTASSLPATLSQSGIPMYSAGVQKFQIAAFEDPNFLVFTISDLPSRQNLNVLVALAPSLQKILTQVGA